MKVIFTQDVRGRGQRGQIKEVPDGYAQNYLIKRGLAKQATKAAMSQLKGQPVQMAGCLVQFQQNKLQLLYKNNLTLKLISERLSWRLQLRRLAT